MITLLHAIGAALSQVRRRKVLASVALVAAASGAGSLYFVVGDAVSHNEGTAARLSTADARSIVVKATKPDVTPIPYRLAAAIAGLPAVTNAVGLGRVQSVRNVLWPTGADAVGLFSMATLAGSPPISLESGRAARPSEVQASGQARAVLGIGAASPGRVETDDQTIFAVVGTYSAKPLGAIHELLNAALIMPAPDGADLSILALVVAQPADLEAVVPAARAILGGLPPGQYTLDFDERAFDVERTIRSEARKGVRALALGLVAIGITISALVAFVDAITRRRDIARQRALGRTRTEVLTTIAIKMTALAFFGACAGACVAALMLQNHDARFDPALLVSSVALITVAGGLASLPGGLFGALQDPAAILRVP